MSAPPPLAPSIVRNDQEKKEELQSIGIAELLRRFSEAAFFVHEAEYRKNGIESPEQVLRPPLTAEELAHKEEELGPLPDDVKEISLIADGFYGGWHFAAGGWGGVAGLWKEAANAHEIYLGYLPKPTKRRIEARAGADKITRDVSVVSIGISPSGSRIDWGSVYVGCGSTENDNYIHVLCPAPVWKKIQNAMGREVGDEEYAVKQYANWNVGMVLMPSMTAWIVNLTANLEALVATNTKAISSP
ncbi:hypothetical protein F5884DRAFT_809354 [Xylogone sp. PMI_703]|nr:hypothetical protein F5884DRAFT_809354 [Xylogone sp. PMI_703]